MKSEFKLQYFPVSFFSMILGLGGFTIAFQKAEEFLHIGFNPGKILVSITLGLFLFFSILYLLKLILFPKNVIQEFNHPIKISFFPTISISLILLGIAFVEFNENLSKIFWYLGAIAHLILSLRIISIWINHTKFDIKHMNPAWFIPAVGNILVPIVGVRMASPEISWFFYSIGIVFWVILLVIFFNRIIFHHPLMEKLLPTLFILIAPPAIGFVAWIKLNGGLDSFAKILYYFALFIFILLLFQIRIFSRIKFYLSWWAYTFPIAAITIASLLMYNLSEMKFFSYFAIFTLSLLSILVILLLTRTVRAVINKEICIEED